MNCRRLKLPVCLLGWVLLGAGAQMGFATPPASTAPPALALMDTLRGVEKRYNGLKTVRLRFQQIYRQSQRVLRQEEGTLYLRKPGRMRWEYENPEPKLFLSDGRRLALYLPKENRMMESAVKKSGDLRTPLRFLLGRLRFDKEFQRFETPTEFAPLEPGNLVLKAFSKRMADRLEWVVFEINPQYQIRRLILQEVGDIQTEFRFEGEETGLDLSPQLFRIQPPEGTEVIRQ